MLTSLGAWICIVPCCAGRGAVFGEIIGVLAFRARQHTRFGDIVSKIVRRTLLYAFEIDRVGEVAIGTVE